MGRHLFGTDSHYLGTIIYNSDMAVAIDPLEGQITSKKWSFP
jgi:hypothetical protein